MTADMQQYQVGQSWSETSRLLTRVLSQGASLGNRDRRTLREAAGLAGQSVRCLTGPSDDWVMEQVAARLSEVVQPIISRPLLVEQLFRAQDVLAMLVGAEPGLERVAVAPGQIAWLQEFLSECCLALWRDLATRQMRHSPLAVGS